MKRGLLIGGGLVIALIIAAVFFLYSSLDSLVKAAVEKYGSEITQTNVRLNEVEIAPTSGKASLRGFKMGNPKSFKTESSFRTGEISVMLDVSSIKEDTIIIKEILVAAPHVTFEQGPNGNNLDAIRRNVLDYIGPSKGQGPAERGGAEEKKGPKLIIESLIIREGRITGSGFGLKEATHSASFPNIHLKGIGKDKGGVTPAELTREIISAIKRSVTQAMGPLILDVARDAAKQGAAKAQEALKEGTKGATDKIQKEVEKAGDKLKKLLGD